MGLELLPFIVAACFILGFGGYAIFNVQGEIIALYWLKEDNGASLLILHDLKLHLMDSEYSRIRVKKIRLASQNVIYDVPVASFWTKMLEGWARSKGCCGRYLYICSLKNEFQIFDVGSGRLIGDKLWILEQNPQIADFSVQEATFDSSKGVLTFFDLEGIQCFLQPDSWKILPLIHFKKQSIATCQSGIDIFNDAMWLKTHSYWMSNYELPEGHGYSGKSYLNFLQYEGSQRYYLSTRVDEQPDDFKTLAKGVMNFMLGNKAKKSRLDKKLPKTIQPSKDQTFLNAMLVAEDTHSLFVFQNPYSVLMLYYALVGEGIKNAWLARISPENEIFWQVRLVDLVAKNIHDDFNAECLRFVYDEGYVHVFYTLQRQVGVSWCKLDLSTGTMEQDPQWIINKNTRKKYLELPQER